MRSLWSGEMIEHHGEFYDVAPVEMNPPVTEPVPILRRRHVGRGAAARRPQRRVDLRPA